MERYSQLILQAIQYIEEHIEDKITLDEIALAVNVSKYHFLRIFTMVTGKSVGEYIFQRRMTNAAEYLSRNKGDVLSIAIRSGYNSQEAFTRAFKDYFKITPGQYDSFQFDRANMFCYPLTQKDLESNKNKVLLKYQLITLKEMTLCGFTYSGTNKKKELSMLVNEFLQYMFKQNANIIENIPWMMGYSSCRIEQNTTKEEIYYLIGVEEQEFLKYLEDKNPRMKKQVIPANLYVQFRLSSNIDHLHTEINQAYQSLLQSEQYFPTGSYVLEKYDRTFYPNDINSYTELLIPVTELNDP